VHLAASASSNFFWKRESKKYGAANNRNQHEALDPSCRRGPANAASAIEIRTWSSCQRSPEYVLLAIASPENPL